MSDEAISDLKYWCKGEPSEVGKRVARLLSIWAGGCHHLDSEQMKKADWQNDLYIQISADSSVTGGGLSTFDFAGLTRLVFLAHDHCIRVDVAPLNFRCLKLMFHPRHHRSGATQARHPTMEDALDSWRRSHPLSEVIQPTIPEAEGTVKP
jgi:hypothetical protein